MTSNEFLRRLRRLGAAVIAKRGKGGDVRVEPHDRTKARGVAQSKTGATALTEQFLGHAYPVQLDPEEDGGYVVTLPDIAYGATQGDTLQEALLQAQDMVEETILGMIAHNEEVPIPSPAKGRPVARLPALTAAKLEVYRAMRQAGLDAAQLAQELGWPAKKITHIFDGYYAVRLEQLEAALAALDRRLVVTRNRREAKPPRSRKASSVIGSNRFPRRARGTRLCCTVLRTIASATSSYSWR